MSGNPTPPISLDAFRKRSEGILHARDKALQDAERYGIAEAEAEAEYLKNKAVAFGRLRIEGKGVRESEILADGEVYELRLARDRAHVLKKSAEGRVALMEANRSMLNREGDWSSRIDPLGGAA